VDRYGPDFAEAGEVVEREAHDLVVGHRGAALLCVGVVGVAEGGGHVCDGAVMVLPKPAQG